MKHYDLIQKAIQHSGEHNLELKIYYSIKILQFEEPSPDAEQFAIQQLTQYINTPLQITLDI